MSDSASGVSSDHRGRRSGAKKTALSSRVSFFSGFTTSSSHSSGSGSTVTQESVSRSQRAARVSSSPETADEQAAPLTVARRESTGPSPAESLPTSINVFAFLEHDPSNPFSTDPLAGVQNATKHTHNGATLQEESDLDCSARSLHSDSGISIRDSSPESLHCRSYSRPALDLLRSVDSPYGFHRSALRPHQSPSKMRPVRDIDAGGSSEAYSPDERYFDDVPETFYRDHPHSSRLIAAESIEVATEDPLSDLSGYDLLAARLTDSYNVECPLRPLYRRFTRLNHRILLQLQDEISQMEEDLASLDAADVRFRRASTGQIAPESRRSNWQWRGSELHARRLDLLGQIYVKVEQYNQAITSFQNVRKGTTAASPSDVQYYRSWMGYNAPIAEVEQRFLDEPEDLLAFCAHKSCPTCEGRASFGPGFVKVIIATLVMVMALFSLFLFMLSPRMGTLLMISIAIALYANRDDVTDVVTGYLTS